MKYILILFTFVTSQLSFAGVRVGNGGDALVCYQDDTHQQRISIDMFDYWEHQQLNLPFGPINLGAKNLTVQDKIGIAVNRLMFFDPTLANEINVIALSIANHINDFLVTQDQLPEITDAHPKALPKNANCFITQFAIQWENTQDGIRRFYISKDLYEDPATNNDTRAGLILHEALYRYAIVNGAKNSDGVRYFNFTLATDFLRTADLIQYANILNTSELNYRECSLLNEPYSGSIHIDRNNKSCFSGSLSLNKTILVHYTDQQFYFEPSSQSLRDIKPGVQFSKINGKLTTPFKSNIKKMELRKRYLTLTSNELPELKFNNEILNPISCLNKATFDLDLSSVTECEINPHYIQLPNGDSFSIWRRVLFNGSIITFNFQQPAEIKMNVPSKSKILIDPSYPTLFSASGVLINGWSMKDIKYLKNGFMGKTKEFLLNNNQMEFFVKEKIDPLYLGLKVILQNTQSDLISLCENKSKDFTYEEHTVTKEYITASEKVYDFDRAVAVLISDSYVNRVNSLECQGHFFIDASLL